MASILQSLNRTVMAGVFLAIVFFIILLTVWPGSESWFTDKYFWSAIFRYLHVLSGVMWIGLLWYFNFVQIPNLSLIHI